MMNDVETTSNTGGNKKFWDEVIIYFPFITYIDYLIPHELHRKQRVQQILYCFVYIRCRGNVLSEPFSSNVRRGYTST
jgi:hypothetical protein